MQTGCTNFLIKYWTFVDDALERLPKIKPNLIFAISSLLYKTTLNCLFGIISYQNYALSYKDKKDNILA